MKQLFSQVALCLVCLLSISSCKKDDPNPTTTPANSNTATNNNTNAKTNYYFSGDINGNTVYIEHLKNNYGVGAGDARSSNGDDHWMGQNTVYMNVFDKTQPMAQIEIVKFFKNTDIVCEDVKNMFAIKSYKFGGRVHGSNPKDGVVITYYDKAGVEWSTDNGSGDQTGSYYKIIEHSINPKKDVEFSEYTSKAEFVCNLYNPSGNKIKLSNGKMWGLTVQCNNL